MKKPILLILCLLIGYLIKANSITNSFEFSQSLSETNEISISKSEVFVGAAANSTASVEVVSQNPLYFINNCNWVSIIAPIIQAPFPEKSIYVIEANRNPFDESREGTFSIYDEFGNEKTISITQMGNAFYSLQLSNNFISINASEDSIFQIGIESNTNWSVVSNKSWLIVSQNTGSQNGTIGLSALPNTLGIERKAEVTIIANGNTTKTINVTQWGQSQKAIEVSTSELAINYYWTDSTMVSITSNTTWSAVSNQDWLIVSPASGSNNGEIYISSIDEDNENTKEGIITVTAIGAAPKTIHVTQYAADDYYITVPQTEFIINNAGFGLIEIPVSSNTFWTTWSNSGYIDINPETGFGNRSLFVSTLPNINEDDVYIDFFIEQRNYDGDLEEIKVDITLKGQSQLFIEPDALNASIAAEGNSRAYLTVYSNLIWTASSNQPWLTIPVPEHDGYGQIELAATANETSDTRNAIVTLSAPGYSSKTILVTQPGNGEVVPTLETVSSQITIENSNGSSNVIEIVSNLNWTAVSNQTWISLDQNSGSNNGILTVTATENTLSTTRQATVTISASGVSPVTVIVTQAAANLTHTLSVSNSNVNIAAAAGSTASVNVSSNTGWTANSNQSWLTVSPLTGSNNGTLLLTASANSASTTRQATVTISASGVSPVTVIVTQAAANIIVVDEASTNITIGSEGDNSVNINIESNTSWSASSNQSWLNVSPASGINNGTITITTEPNLQTSNRQGIISISANGITITITVNQKGINNNMVNVTFNVDMTYVNSLVDEVFISGTFCNWSEKYPLTANGNIWTTTLALSKNEKVDYKFVYKHGLVEYWENVKGECITNDGYGNRWIVVPDHSVTVDLVYFNQCDYVELTALAGIDQQVNEGEIVYLTGNYNGVFESSTVFYQWHAPTEITLSSSNMQNPTFTAPLVEKDTYFVFLLTVNSGSIVSEPDELSILVKDIVKTNTNYFTEEDVKVFPNPGNGLFHVETGVSFGEYNVSIYNLIGMKVLEAKRYNENNTTIDLSDQKKGIYLLKVSNLEKTFIKKLIIQ